MTLENARNVLEENYGLEPMSKCFRHDEVLLAFQQHPELVNDSNIFVSGSPLTESLFFRPSLQLVKEVSNGLAREIDLHVSSPLHLACQVGADSDVIDYLARRNPESLSYACPDFGTPLYIVCQPEANANPATLRRLVEMDPSALLMRGPSGATPLESAILNNLSAEHLDILLGYNQDQHITLEEQRVAMLGSTLEEDYMVDEHTIAALFSHSNVRSLNCSRCILSPGARKRLFENIAQSSSIEKLSISVDANTVGEEEGTTVALENMLVQNRSLRVLHLRLTQGIKRIRAAGKSLSRQRQAFEDALSKGVAANSTLVEIRIEMPGSDRMCDDTLVKILGNTSVRRFSFVNVENCGLALVEGLENREVGIEQFAAFGCGLNCFEIKKVVASLVKSSATVLTDLWISQYLTEAQLQDDALNGLSRLQNLRTLQFYHNGMRECHVRSLLGALAQNPLESLSFGGDAKWSEAAVGMLAKSLETARLEKLSLGYISSTFAWDRLVAPLQRSNCWLQEVSFVSSSQMKSQALQQVEYLCELNKAGRAAGRNCKERLVDSLTETSDVVSLSFGLLRDMPHIWSG